MPEQTFVVLPHEARSSASDKTGKPSRSLAIYGAPHNSPCVPNLPLIKWSYPLIVERGQAMMQPAGRRSKRKRQQPDEQGALDPIALTLALWLGLVVAVSALLRISNDAMADVAVAEAGAERGRQAMVGRAAADVPRFNPRLMAFGG